MTGAGGSSAGRIAAQDAPAAAACRAAASRPRSGSSAAIASSATAATAGASAPPVASAARLAARAPAVVAATATGLFAQYNWHLFWFAVPLTLLLRRHVLAGSPALRTFGLFLLLGCGFLFVLFVLTPAGRWAESYTVVNRLGLQIVPAMLVFAALLWREPERDAEAAHARMAGAAPSGQ